MTITRAELAKDVLVSMGVVPIGGTPEAEDEARIIEKYKHAHALLQTEDYLPFDDDDDIDTEYVIALSGLTAAIASPSYGLQSDVLNSLDAARVMIQRINNDQSVSRTTTFSDC